MAKVTIDFEAKYKGAVKDVEQLNKTVENLEENNKKANKALDGHIKKVSKSSALAKKGLKGLVKGVGGLGKAFKKVGIGLLIAALGVLANGLRSNQTVVDAFNVVLGTITDVGKQAAQMFVDMFKRVSDATGGFDAMQKVIGGAFTISLNLVVGLIQGLTLGVQYAQLAWENSIFGGKDADKIKELQSNIDETKEKLSETGKSISTAGKQIKDNFVEAVQEVGALTKGIAETTQKAINEIDVEAAKERSKTIVQLQKDATLAIAENEKLQLQYQKDAELQRQIRDDVTKSLADRTKANIEIGKILDKQEKVQKKNAQINVDLATEKLAVDKDNIDLQVEKINAEKAYIDVLESVAGFRSEQMTNEAGLQLESIDLIKSKTEAENTRELQTKQFAAEQLSTEYERVAALRTLADEEREIEEKRLQDNINSYVKGTQARQDAEQELSNFQEQASQKELTLDKLVQSEKLKLTSATFGQLVSILGKNSKAGKAAATAQAVINSYLAFTDVLKTPTTIPEPFGSIQKAISAASILASGLQTVKQINAVQLPAGSGGGGAGGGITSQAPSINVVGAAPENQLAQVLGEQEQKPVKAFVVSSDVSTAQSLDRNIIDNASIG